MGYPTKVQVIRRKDSEQWYINFPAAIAQAMEFTKGETVEWVIQDRQSLLLSRMEVAAHRPTKKKVELLSALLDLWDKAMHVFKQQRTGRRARSLGVDVLEEEAFLKRIGR